MNKGNHNIYTEEFGVDKGLVELAREVEYELKEVFADIDETREYNQLKVIKAMQEYGLSETHFYGSTGYGYGDRGRDVLDKVFAKALGADDAIVRHSLVSGTHALSTTLYGVLRPGDKLLSITGKPYDTLEEVIGIRGEGMGSLKELGINYEQIELNEEGYFDIGKIEEAMTEDTRMVFIQRSRGYAWRDSFKIDDIKDIINFVKEIKNDIIVMVDNCYGEFTEKIEPTEVGADVIAGSLIKNPGGGIALTGGYIAGKKELIERISYRVTTPGLGKEVGCSLNNNRSMFQGLFFAPHVVSESLKGMVLCAGISERLGYETCPSAYGHRSDIIQAIKFGSADKVIAFCQGVQKGSPVDAFVRPEPWDMPGYESPVIMAAGAFVQGSSIELSADAPIREPYVAYIQGGLVYDHVKLGLLTALQEFKNKGFL